MVCSQFIKTCNCHCAAIELVSHVTHMNHFRLDRRAIKIHEHESILLALFAPINCVSATTGPEIDFQSASFSNFTVT
jgi:hypothetical protein